VLIGLSGHRFAHQTHKQQFIATLDWSLTMLRSPNIGFILLGLLLFCPNQVTFAQAKSYGIRHYDLLIEPDFMSKTISVTASAEIQNPAFQTSFSFGLNDRYETVNVNSDSSSVMIQRANRSITVTTSRPTKEFTLVFRLGGKLGRSDDEEREVVTDSSLFLLWSDRFYPIDFERWTTVKTEVVVPTGFQVIAPGSMTKSELSGSNTRFVFESATPTVKFSVLADTRWIRTRKQVNGIQMQTLLYPGSGRFVDQIFRTSSEILQFYSSTFCPYPFEEFSFVTVDGMYARRAFPGFVGYEPRYLEKEFTTTGHDAHETSLLWWGYIIHGSGPGSFQWTEGLGDYAEILYDEQYKKPIPKIFAKFRSEYLSLPAEQDVPYTELTGNTPQKILHGKYPWLMHVVRYVIGDSAFHKVMKMVFQRFRFRTFSMAEFISTLEKGSGQSLRWWRDEWLNRKGVPEIAMKSRVQRTNSGYRITCILEQRGNIYHIPLEIGIESLEGAQVEKVNLQERQMTFTFESKEEPLGVVLDPRGWLLAKKTSLE